MSIVEQKITNRTRTRPFAPWPHFEADEIAAVTEVLTSGKVNYWTGTVARQFEQDFAGFVGAHHAVALANGTVALELALIALGIGPGDEVIVPPRTYVGTATAVVVCGATPVFAEVDHHSQNLTAAGIEAVLTPRTKAIIPVHLFGYPCDMHAIMALAEKHGLKVIEDCAQALGTTYHGQHMGTFGHVAAWSFCQDKIMTTGGEGGMLTTNDPEVWKTAWAYKDHGKSYEAVYNRTYPPGFRFLVEMFGTNWRMTEMQAAIGCVALPKVSAWVEKRRTLAGILDQRLEQVPGLRIPVPDAHIRHAYYKYSAFVRLEHLKPDWDRDRIMIETTNRGIPCFSGICGEIYLEKAFKTADLQPAERLPVARQLGNTSLQLLVHPTLSVQDMHDTADILSDVMAEAVA